MITKAMERREVRMLSCQVDAKLAQRLVRRARLSDRSVSAVMRMALREYLRQHEEDE